MEECISQLMAMADGVGTMAKEAEFLLEKIKDIRKRSEEIEALVSDCITLMEK